jgi:hypothetical protein
MTSRDFAYWLQGFLEVSNPTHIGETETTIIRNHLNMVFKHEIDPSHGDKKHQEVLGAIHRGPFDLGDTKLNC